jgi:membrane protein
MFSNVEVPLSLRELVTRTYHKTMSDDSQGLASQLAYYFFLALFPALLCLLAIASFFPLQNFTDDLLRLLGPFAPHEMLDIIRQELTQIAEGHHGGLFTIGLLGALWSSSAAMVAMIAAMNRAYDIEEGRPWWRIRLTAIALTVGLSVLVIAAFALIVAGPQLADFAGRHLGLGSVAVRTWKIVQWPLAFAMVTVGIGLIYYFAPDAEQIWVWITPGSLAATCLWLLGSLVFRFYAVNFGHYQATYGAIGGVILLLLWFYLSGLVIVIGAEMNAEIEHASPWGKAPGEKVPGRKKQIGAAAARTYRAALAGKPRHEAASAAPSVRRPPQPAPGTQPAPVWECIAALLFVLWRVRRRRSHEV